MHFVRNGHKLPQGAYLVISNHHNNWDPIYMNLFLFGRIPHFVANEEVFYNRFTAFFFGVILGQIKRGMSFTDVGYLRQLQKFAADGKVIGIYPEGDISMFGDTLPIDIAIAKLVKMLKIPVVCTRVTGGHLRSPRVAKFARRSRITYTITDIISIEEVAHSDAEALHQRMEKAIVHHENLWQQTANVKTGALLWRALWLETAFFYCPQCHQWESFFHRNNELYCRKCDFHLHADRFYRFSYPDDAHNKYPHLVDSTTFNDFQMRALDEHLLQFNDQKPLVFTVEGIRFHAAENGKMFHHKYLKGSFKLYYDHLEVFTQTGIRVYNIKWADVISTMVQYKDVCELKLKNYRLRLYKKKGTWNGYLYVETIKRLIAQNGQIVV